MKCSEKYKQLFLALLKKCALFCYLDSFFFNIKASYNYIYSVHSGNPWDSTIRALLVLCPLLYLLEFA
jgi:hypothetical protein